MMVRQMIMSVVVISVLASCNGQSKSKYPERTGDIAYDESLDNPNFEVCDEQRILQHYAPYSSAISALYEGDKTNLIESYDTGYSHPNEEGQDGYITTRFVVNCHGKTGRFRTETMCLKYQPFQFDEAIMDKIINITKGLLGWQPMEIKGRTYDYYIYVSIRLENGQIVKVLP